MEKITAIRVPVPYRGPGNTIRYTDIEFQVFRAEGLYKAIAVDAAKDKRLTDLPEEMLFEHKNNKWQLIDKGEEEVMMTIIHELEKEKDPQATELKLNDVCSKVYQHKGSGDCLKPLDIKSQAHLIVILTFPGGENVNFFRENYEARTLSALCCCGK